ncbi:MAG: methylenetetrahydrofolate reductase [Rhizobiaceae bacterium]|nr:methylenetetrahydrofolate reductase [Rhizobiaceae bacterium]
MNNMENVSDFNGVRGGRLHASIEVSARQAAESAELPGLFPSGIRVYIPDLGNDSDRLLVSGAKRLSDLGYRPVPHLAARRFATQAQLESRIKALTQGAGVRDMLVIAGGLSRPAGAFSSTMDVLETGLLDQCGVTDIGVGGHPEGSPDFSEATANEALRLKAEFAKRTDARLRIVTQFGFDGAGFVRWAQGLEDHGIDLPVHFGVAGPAKLTTLIKYAITCGVGNSIGLLRKRAGSLAALTTVHSPELVVEPVEEFVRGNPGSNIVQLHVFAFGGISRTSEWLNARGSWKALPHEPAAAAL